MGGWVGGYVFLDCIMNFRMYFVAVHVFALFQIVLFYATYIIYKVKIIYAYFILHYLQS